MTGYKKLLLILSIMIFALVGCQKKENIDIRGEIVSIDLSDDNKVASILVQGELEEDTKHDNASIKVDDSTTIYQGNTKNKVSLDELQVGMIVEAVFDGPVAESYPVQAKAKTVRIIEQSKASEISSDSDISLELKESDYTSIDDLLNKQENVDIISWSPDKSCVAFIIRDANWEGKVYLWHIGDQKPTEIHAERDLIGDFIWSPDSQYVIVDIGTSISRTSYVVRAKDNELLYSISYISRVLWSPDSKFIAMTRESDEKIIIETELEGTTDVYLFNVETEEMQIIDKGAPEYFLWLTSWDDDGLHYIRSYVNESDKSEELIYKYE